MRFVRNKLLIKFQATAIILISFGLFLSITPELVLAKENLTSASTCIGIDVVFLIDQSSSMSGYKAGKDIFTRGEWAEAANDEAGQRVNAARWVIDWLTDNAFDICKDTVHRLAVISYGTETHIDLELTKIDPNDQTQWSYLREVLRKKIQPLYLGQTNPLAAFEEANRIFGNADPIPDSDVRKKAIVFITDGRPFLKDETFDSGRYLLHMMRRIKEMFPEMDETLLARERCIEHLYDVYEKRDEPIPPEEKNKCYETNQVHDSEVVVSTYIWTLLLNNNTGYGPEVLEEYTAMTENHAGQLIHLEKSPTDIPDNFLSILDRLVGVETERIACGNFAVNPYLRSARLTFFKMNEDVKVRLIFSDGVGNTYTVEDGKGHESVDEENYLVEGTNERYIFNEPLPGIWKIESDYCQDIDIYYQPISFASDGLAGFELNNETFDVSLRLPEVDIGPYFDSQRSYYLVIYLKDTSGQELSAYSDDFFSIEFTVEVAPVSAESEWAKVYEMEWQPEKNYYRSTTPLQLPMDGTYRINVQGLVKYREVPYFVPEGDSKSSIFSTEHQIMNIENLEFTVFPVDVFDVLITSPKEGSNIGTVHETPWTSWSWPLNLPIRSFEVRAQVIEGREIIDGEPVSPDYQPLNASNILRTTKDVMYGSLEVDNQPVQNLTFTYDEETNEFVAEVQEVDLEGEYTVTAQIGEEYKIEFRPGKRSDQVTFSRSDTAFTTEAFYMVVMIILVLIFAALIFWYFAVRTNKLKGELAFIDPSGEEILTIPLAVGKNYLNVNSRLLKNYPQLDLDSLRVESVKNDKAQEEIPDTSDFGEDEWEEGRIDKILVKGRRSDTKDNFEIELEQGSQMTYSDNSVASFVFKYGTYD